MRVHDQIMHGVYAHDTLTLLPTLKLVAGIRGDYWKRNVHTETEDPTAPGVCVRSDTPQRHASGVTWPAGLVYQPLDWVTA